MHRNIGRYISACRYIGQALVKNHWSSLSQLG